MAVKTVAIIGLGLIGGSIAKDLSKQKDKYRVMAADRDLKVLEKAFAEDIISAYSVNGRELVRRADITVLCLPVCAMKATCAELAASFKPGSILTDVGSVKGYLQRELAEVLPETVTYVGGHPMAGSERRGFECSEENLFVNRPFVLVKPIRNMEALTEVSELVRSLRANPIVMEAAEHDLATAMLSHMPHVISAALMLAAAKDEEIAEARLLAAGCFRDMTRVSSADPRMWTDICLANAEAIMKQIDKMKYICEQAMEKIKVQDERWLLDFFNQAKDGREEFKDFLMK